jgi:hypothetical protein
MISAEVTELVQGYTIAKTLETTESELIRTIFPHPTLAETVHEAVLDAYGRAIHISRLTRKLHCLIIFGIGPLSKPAMPARPEPGELVLMFQSGSRYDEQAVRPHES